VEPKSFGRKLGIGVRVASRVVKERVDAHAQQAAQAPSASPAPTAAEASPGSPAAHTAAKVEEVTRQVVETVRQKSAEAAQGVTRTAREQAPAAAAKARGLGTGAKRFGQALWGPFAHVSSVLWSEVTGVFFGLFAVYFAQGIFRYRADHASGVNHQKFVLDVILTIVFGYFAVSSFYIARRKEKRKRG
jgi:uncharacterized membrane protein